MGTISVLLADDHAVVRQGLRMLLQTESGIEIVGEAENGTQAVELAGELKPAVVLMDVAMPIMNGLILDQRIRELSVAKSGKPWLIVVSGYRSEDLCQRCLAEGIDQYFLKPVDPECLQKFLSGVS